MNALALSVSQGRAARYGQERVKAIEDTLQKFVTSLRIRLSILRWLQFLPLLIPLLLASIYFLELERLLGPTSSPVVFEFIFFQYGRASFSIWLTAFLSGLVIYIARASTAPENFAMAESLLAEARAFRLGLDGRALREESLAADLSPEQFERFEELVSRISRRFPGLIGSNAGRVTFGEPKAGP